MKIIFDTENKEFRQAIRTAIEREVIGITREEFRSCILSEIEVRTKNVTENIIRDLLEKEIKKEYTENFSWRRSEMKTMVEKIVAELINQMVSVYQVETKLEEVIQDKVKNINLKIV